MPTDLEEMIRQRAHAIWEQEGQPHGRYEEHWQRAAGQIAQELERIKAAHRPATADKIKAPNPSCRDRPRQADGGEPTKTPRMRGSKTAASADSAAVGDENAGADMVPQSAPRTLGRKAASEAQSDAASLATTTRRRVPKGTDGAQSEPAGNAAPKTRRRASDAVETAPSKNAADAPVRRGRKPRAQSGTLH